MTVRRRWNGCPLMCPLMESIHYLRRCSGRMMMNRFRKYRSHRVGGYRGPSEFLRDHTPRNFH